MSILKQHHISSSPTLKRCKSFTFDVNQQAESLVQWEQRYNQHSSGTFNGYLDELKLDGIHFFEEFTNRTLLQQCSINEDNLWLGFSLQQQRPKINNQEILAGQIMTRPSGVEFELLTPSDFSIYGLVINKESLSKEMVGPDIELWQNQSTNMQVSAPNHYVTYELAKIINLVLNTNNSTIGNSEILDQNNLSRLTKLSPLITSKVADLLSRTEYDYTDPKVTHLTTNLTIQKVVADITNYVKETSSYPLTISELCKITGVGRRTLQYCFEHGFGISPIQYIRDCRLNEIRRILLNSEDKDIIIADLALDFGFYHIATFNSQYKHLFGETPSQTIKRSSGYHSVPMIKDITKG
ncbi:helix-turn-helix domain-containing protein [Pseudocolwellia agarivorans]|uniref:helix-turn-helix domain-containing protein n=1 Tax=Pseudocolwellia agarivorans TaxID=1911682 RepID=UPI003F88327C